MKNQQEIKMVTTKSSARPDPAAIVAMITHMARRQIAARPNGQMIIMVLLISVQTRRYSNARPMSQIRQNVSHDPLPSRDMVRPMHGAQSVRAAVQSGARAVRNVVRHPMRAAHQAINAIAHKNVVAGKNRVAHQNNAARPAVMKNISPRATDLARPIMANANTVNLATRRDMDIAAAPLARSDVARPLTMPVRPKLVRPKSPLNPMGRVTTNTPVASMPRPQNIGSRPLPPRVNPVATLGNRPAINRAPSPNPVATRGPAPIIPLRGNMNAMRMSLLAGLGNQRAA